MSDMLADGGLTHHRPDYGFRSARMGNDVVGVAEESRFETPFGTLLRFRKDTELVQPRVLVVAPMSGHFATLLRGTVAVLLPALVILWGLPGKTADLWAWMAALASNQNTSRFAETTSRRLHKTGRSRRRVAAYCNS